MASDRPPALRVFKIAYWSAVVSLPLLAVFMVPRDSVDVLVNQMTVIFYTVAAAAGYRLLLLIAWHVTDSDQVEREIEESEGRVELNLDDRKRR